ncbi:hypothetical protein ACFYWX_32160 [Streptomyces sp. NPDC002888]|uniref:hypothetical protein n=1 Tax=Streptomyces sp. NPDC002888 TaxID=3364668 RepID=UPI003683D776
MTGTFTERNSSSVSDRGTFTERNSSSVSNRGASSRPRKERSAPPGSACLSAAPVMNRGCATR